MSTLGEDILKACVPFTYGNGQTSHQCGTTKTCSRPGCERPRHVSANGYAYSYCKQCCRAMDKASRQRTADKPCATPGCTNPRYVRANGLPRPHCKECCRVVDKRWYEFSKRKATP